MASPFPSFARQEGKRNIKRLLLTEIVLHGAHRNGGAQGQVKDVEKRGKRNHLKWRMAGSKVKLGGGGINTTRHTTTVSLYAMEPGNG